MTGLGLTTTYQAYQTPKEEFDRLNSIFNFTIDCCASDTNHLLPRYWTEADSCLDHDWTGERIFCNPPFSKMPEKILSKVREAELILVLLPLNTLTARYVHDNKPDYLIIPDHRIKFYKENVEWKQPTFGTCGLLYSKNKIDNCGLNLIKWK
jgi:phage N-6-adenine-methyltransferase